MLYIQFLYYQTSKYIILQTGTTYSMITNDNLCVHIDGQVPDFCNGENISSIESMESYCTNQPSCVGYSYNAIDKLGHLYPSDETCPSGFTYYKLDSTVKTLDDLVAAPESYGLGWVGCYGKTPTV